MDVSENIKKHRKKKGLTQKELSELSGLSEITIRKIEAGDSNPKIATLASIADALEIPVMTLYGKEPFIKIGTDIRNARKRLNITRQDLYEVTQIPVEKIRDYELGLDFPSNFEEMTPILDALDITNIDLFPPALGSGLSELFPDEVKIIDEFGQKVLDLFEELNNKGKEKVVEHAELLCKLSEYRKDDTQP